MSDFIKSISRFCGDYLPDDIISTGESPHIFTSKEHKETFGFKAIQNICLWCFPGNVMTLKFLSDASVTAGGFQLQYIAFNASLPHK